MFDLHKIRRFHKEDTGFLLFPSPLSYLPVPR